MTDKKRGGRPARLGSRFCACAERTDVFVNTYSRELVQRMKYARSRPPGAQASLGTRCPGTVAAPPPPRRPRQFPGPGYEGDSMELRLTRGCKYYTCLKLVLVVTGSFHPGLNVKAKNRLDCENVIIINYRINNNAILAYRIS